MPAHSRAAVGAVIVIQGLVGPALHHACGSRCHAGGLIQVLAVVGRAVLPNAAVGLLLRDLLQAGIPDELGQRLDRRGAHGRPHGIVLGGHAAHRSIALRAHASGDRTTAATAATGRSAAGAATQGQAAAAPPVSLPTLPAAPLEEARDGGVGSSEEQATTSAALATTTNRALRCSYMLATSNTHRARRTLPPIDCQRSAGAVCSATTE